MTIVNWIRVSMFDPIVFCFGCILLYYTLRFMVKYPSTTTNKDLVFGFVLSFSILAGSIYGMHIFQGCLVIIFSLLVLAKSQSIKFNSWLEHYHKEK